MSFSVRVAFDSGKNTGGWDGRFDYQNAYEYYGYTIGCNTLGVPKGLGAGIFPICPTQVGQDQKYCPPDGSSDVRYENAYWYSLPGKCPTLEYNKKTEACEKSQPGGLCQGVPTGTSNCTWSYEDAGFINLDDLSGISSLGYKSYADFCKAGCREYGNFQPFEDKGGCGVTYWDHRFDVAANRQRVHKADQMFKAKYPAMPSDSDLATPSCDFNRTSFYLPYWINRDSKCPGGCKSDPGVYR